MFVNSKAKNGAIYLVFDMAMLLFYFIEIDFLLRILFKKKMVSCFARSCPLNFENSLFILSNPGVCCLYIDDSARFFLCVYVLLLVLTLVIAFHIKIFRICGPFPWGYCLYIYVFIHFFLFYFLVLSSRSSTPFLKYELSMSIHLLIGSNEKFTFILFILIVIYFLTKARLYAVYSSASILTLKVV